MQGRWITKLRRVLLLASPDITCNKGATVEPISQRGRVFVLALLLLAMAPCLALMRPPAASAAPLPRDAIVQGPLNVDNAAIADKGLAELNSNPGPRATGFNQPGECVRSVARWLMAAGGPDLSGDDISTYTSLGAVTIDAMRARATWSSMKVRAPITTGHLAYTPL
jgi:hypothetical protein